VHFRDLVAATRHPRFASSGAREAVTLQIPTLRCFAVHRLALLPLIGTLWHLRPVLGWQEIFVGTPAFARARHGPCCTLRKRFDASAYGARLPATFFFFRADREGFLAFYPGSPAEGGFSLL